MRFPRFYYGWWIVVVSFIGDFMSAGVGAFAFSLFLKPMSEELGWARSMTAGAFTLRTIAGAVSAPIMGPLLDRYGARPLMVFGALLGGFGILALSRTTELWHFYLFYGVLGAIGLIEFGGFITSTAISKWFIRKRGRALAIATMGITLGGVVLTPVAQYLISNFGWRTAWLVLGITIWAVVVAPAAIFMRRRPEDMGLLPDGDKAPANDPSNTVSHARPADQEQVWTLKAALKTPTLWLALIAFNLNGLGASAIVIHEVAYLTDRGYSTTLAVAVATGHALFAALGTFVAGLIAEKVSVRHCLIVAFLGASVGVGILMNAANTTVLLFFALIYGFSLGSYIVLNPLVWANYYGRTFLGTIRGVVMPLQMLASSIGPLFAALIYDSTASYQWALSTYMVCWLLAAFFIFLAKPPRAPKPAETELAREQVGSV